MVFGQTREGPKPKGFEPARVRVLNPATEPVNEEVKEKEAKVK